jgi:hypothetical protein
MAGFKKIPDNRQHLHKGRANPPGLFYAPQNILNPAFTSQKAVSKTFTI